MYEVDETLIIDETGRSRFTALDRWFGAVLAVGIIVALAMFVLISSCAHSAPPAPQPRLHVTQGLPQTLTIGRQYHVELGTSDFTHKPIVQCLQADSVDVRANGQAQCSDRVSGDYAGPATLTVLVFDGALSHFVGAYHWHGLVTH